MLLTKNDLLCKTSILYIYHILCLVYTIYACIVFVYVHRYFSPSAFSCKTFLGSTLLSLSIYISHFIPIYLFLYFIPSISSRISSLYIYLIPSISLSLFLPFIFLPSISLSSFFHLLVFTMIPFLSISLPFSPSPFSLPLSCFQSLQEDCSIAKLSR